MKVLVIPSALLAAVTVMAACSHAASQTDLPPSLALVTGGKWTANIKPVMQDRLNHPDSTGGRNFGTLEWVPGKTPTTSTAFISFTSALTENDLSWGILFGSCNSASLPVEPISNFPEIDVRTNGGRGHASVSLSIELPKTGQYHVDVYSDRQGSVESVIGCGNLRHSTR